MSDKLGKKFSDLMGKFDDKVLQAKLNSAIDMLKNGKTEDLAKKLNKLDKDELLAKIEEFDESKLDDLKIDKDELKKRISSADLDKLSKLIGENGDELVKKLTSFLSK